MSSIVDPKPVNDLNAGTTDTGTASLPPHDRVAERLSASQLPEDVEKRIRTSRTEQAALDEARVQSGLMALRERYRAGRMKLISMEIDQKLKEYSVAHRLSEPAKYDIAERSRVRAATTAYARELGVDLGAMSRLWEETCRELENIVATPRSGESTIMESVERQPMAEASSQTFFPPWHGSWDQGFWSSTTDPSSTTWTSQSYWEWDKRVGSFLGFKRGSADNDDGAYIAHSSGVLVQFTMPRTGSLKVTAGLTRAFGKHFIDTDDEAGWSLCNVQVKESVVAEVYWDWNDWTADSHVEGLLAHTWTVSSEAWRDTTPIPAGAFRVANLHDKNVVFPAGQTVVIYAGIKEEVYAWVDDVRVRANANAAWYPNWVAVTVV